MKGKINARLVIILGICAVLSVVFVNMTFKAARVNAQPEREIPVVVFGIDAGKGTFIEEGIVSIIHIPTSLFTPEMVQSKDEIVGKKLIVDVVRGEQAFHHKVTDRGSQRFETSDLFLISIDVPDISDVLAAQLKLGSEYALYHVEELENPRFIDLITVTEIVDQTGQKVIENGSSTVKSLIIGVDSERLVKKISAGKDLGRFDIVKPPVSFINRIHASKKRLSRFDYLEQECLEKRLIVVERMKRKQSEVNQNEQPGLNDSETENSGSEGNQNQS